MKFYMAHGGHLFTTAAAEWGGTLPSRAFLIFPRFGGLPATLKPALAQQAWDLIWWQQTIDHWPQVILYQLQEPIPIGVLAKALK
ncbi:MAG: hypothetical protein ACE1Y4_19000 [Lysobacterales bacterium]